MKSSMNQMDVEEGWELLPDDGYLEIHDDGGKQIYSRNHHHHHPSSVFHMNYFMLPPPPPPNSTTRNQLLPIPIVLESDERVSKTESMKTPLEMKIIPPEKMESFAEQDPAVSQVFFKKMNETEFVDMKVESPRSNITSSNRGIMSHDQIEDAFHQFEEKEGDDNPCKSEMNQMKKESDEDEGGGLKIWKWNCLSGIGAICSFAAATVCIIVFSNHHHRNQKLQFQIHSSTDKNNKRRMKQVVEHANKLNEAITAARGAAITRARITVGGYYDASSSSSL